MWLNPNSINYNSPKTANPRPIAPPATGTATGTAPPVLAADEAAELAELAALLALDLTLLPALAALDLTLLSSLERLLAALEAPLAAVEVMEEMMEPTILVACDTIEGSGASLEVWAIAVLLRAMMRMFCGFIFVWLGVAVWWRDEFYGDFELLTSA